MPLYKVGVFETFTAERHTSIEIMAQNAEEAKGTAEGMYFNGELEGWVETERGAGNQSFHVEDIPQESTGG